MSAPTTTADALQRAMADFDRRLRGTPTWTGWEQNKAHKFAIQNGAHLYPVKCILSIATGVPVSDFQAVSVRAKRRPRCALQDLRSSGFPVATDR